jgi:hypothetical protein
MGSRTTLLPFVAAALTAGLPAGALAVGLTATVDSTETRVGEAVMLTLTVDGSRSGAPKLPDLDGFQVYDRGQTTEMRIVNGRMSSGVSYNFALVPTRPGTFTIGAASIEIDGRTYESRPFVLRVVGGGEQPGEGQDVLVIATVSNDRPVVGEQVIYSVRFFTRVQIANGSLGEPDFAGLTKQSLGDKRAYEATLKGQQYQVTEFRWAVFPERPGEISIAPATVTCDVVVSRRRQRRDPFGAFFDSPFDDFFGRAQTQNRVVRSAAITLDVRPLPPPPPGFSGLVGEFTVRATLSQAQAHVGESATLTVSVAGTGNAAAIGEPQLSGIEAFKVYDDKPTVDIQTPWEGVRGSKVFKKALVPLAEGELRLAAIRVPYFDPRAGIYRTAKSEPLTLQALPATSKEDLKLTESIAPAGGKVSVRVLADDILPIYRKLDALTPQNVDRRMTALAGAGLVAPPLGWLALAAVLRRRERYQSNTALRRSRSARRQAKAATAAARAAEKQGQRAPAAELASRAVRVFIGDRLNIEGGALTPADAERLLAEHGAAATAGAVRRFLEECDAVQYGASATAEAEPKSARAEELIAALVSEL